MTGLLPHLEKRCTMDFKQTGDQIFLIGRLREELGGSEYLAVVHGMEAGAVPDVDLQEEKALINCLQMEWIPNYSILVTMFLRVDF